MLCVCVCACVRACSGVEKIYAAIGGNIATIVQWDATFLAAFVVGLVTEYRLALLLLAIMPLLAIAAYLIGKVI